MAARRLCTVVGKMATPSKHVPKDAQVIMSIMKDMGINEYEPRVINQLLEFTYRKYVGVNSCVPYDYGARIGLLHTRA
jgi:Transcription initiation factor TFIID, subunit TAF9 (also component of histone acetyltransferase SAGA)